MVTECLNGVVDGRGGVASSALTAEPLCHYCRTMEYELRRTWIVVEQIHAEHGGRVDEVITRIVGLAAIDNPYVAAYQDDLSALFHVGADLGKMLMSKMVPLSRSPVTSYGKAALVGTLGDVEHGHALLHPALGQMMRDPIGGGEALIPSSVKVAAAGAPLDIPMSHKDNPWSFDHFDSISVSVPDAPRPTELVMVCAIADGGRPNARSGSGRINTGD